MSISNYLEDLMLDWAFNQGSPTRPTSFFVGLHDGDPGETGASNEQVVGTDPSYTRTAVTIGAAASGVSKNTGAVNYTPHATAPMFYVSYVSIWDAASAGNCLWYGPTLVTIGIDNSNPLNIAINKLVASLD